MLYGKVLAINNNMICAPAAYESKKIFIQLLYIIRYVCHMQRIYQNTLTFLYMQIVSLSTKSELIQKELVSRKWNIRGGNYSRLLTYRNPCVN